MKALAGLAALLALAGCAHQPNQPGAGYGATYTPVIDMHGLDTSRYSADLATCRAYANTINAQQQEIGGMIAGALIGGAIGAAFGGGKQFNSGMATYGAASGLGSASNRARGKQETILANCMAGRGYRVLDGATMPAASNVPSPYAAQQVYQPAPIVQSYAQPPQAAPIVHRPAPEQASTPVREVGGAFAGCRWATPTNWVCDK